MDVSSLQKNAKFVILDGRYWSEVTVQTRKKLNSYDQGTLQRRSPIWEKKKFRRVIQYTRSDARKDRFRYADEVVAIIAGLAATEVKGVASMAGNITNELVSKLGIKNLSKGVKIASRE